MMARRPENQPILDALPAVSLSDPEPAAIRHLQRAEIRTHAAMSEWGGPPIWVPLHWDTAWLAKTSNPELRVAVPPGVEYVRVRALVSGAGAITLTSGTTADTTELTWEDNGSGDSIEGAVEVATLGGEDDADCPLQLRSGHSWDWDVDDITVSWSSTPGTIWGLLIEPIHLPQ